MVGTCLVSPKTNSPSPAQHPVQPDAQKANSYQFSQSMTSALETKSQRWSLATCVAAVATTLLTINLGFNQTCHAELTSQVLHEFSSTNGGPWELWEIIQGQDGSFYGSSSLGGSNNAGTIFRMTAAGDVTTLFSFGGAYGYYPEEGLIEGADGNFYGTTYQDFNAANGTIFKISPEGIFTNLHHFDCSLGEGIGPICRLTQTPDGDLYGTTYFGGASGCLGNGVGTVFKVTTNGILSTILSFNRTNGSNPQCGLILGTDGALYGSTTGGGGPSGDGLGTIFRLTTNGALTTLHTFNGPTDGARPSGNLLLASDGNFYGTTEGGRTNDSGTIFKMASGGSLTTIFDFNGTNGSFPHGDLVQGSDGTIYGRTIGGGSFRAGTLFRLNTNGDLATILSFGSAKGENPWAALVPGRDGNLYGTTFYGGSGDGGVVFRLVSLPVITDFGRSNQSVTLMWTSFTNGIYRLEQTTNLVLTNWTPIATPITATANSTTLVAPLQTDSRSFYRIVLLP
jgi:uncharacterized repeat protein (TIGR03803 family)